MSAQNTAKSIAIVGGGIAGATLAIALVQRGINVQLYEQAKKFGEIGAGVAFNPAATRAMKICSDDVYEAFNKVATRNQSESKKHVWFDWVDGFNDKEVGKEEWCFAIDNEDGNNAVHRAHLLDNLVKAVPAGITQFSKRLETIEELDDGKLKLKFHDGSDALADAGISIPHSRPKVTTNTDTPQLLAVTASNLEYAHGWWARIIPLPPLAIPTSTPTAV